MNINTLISLANLYAQLGSAVQEQLIDFVEGEDGDINANALRMIRNWVKAAKAAAMSSQDTVLLEDCGRVLDDIEEYFR